jgi:hypothetical protein
MRRTTTLRFLCCAALLSSCATPLQEPPPQEEVLEDALPETTEIRAEWAAPADDAGQVDDGWLATFGDPQLEALVAEALIRKTRICEYCPRRSIVQRPRRDLPALR